MMEIFTRANENDAINMLKIDHAKVKNLFDEFKEAKSLVDRKKIVAQAITELKIHADIEEKIFYPSIRTSIEKDLMTEADEEHHVAKLLIAELEVMTGKEEHYNSKFKVLAENVKHHIKEEEGEMFPKARALLIDMVSIGSKMTTLKKQLMEDGVAKFAEEKMIAKTKKDKGSSPAQAAKKTASKK